MLRVLIFRAWTQGGALMQRLDCRLRSHKSFPAGTRIFMRDRKMSKSDY